MKNFKSLLPFLIYSEFKDEKVLVVSVTHLLVLMTILKKHINYQYKLLSCISGVDFLNVYYRFCVSYELLSLVYNTRVRVKIFIDEISCVSSIFSLYMNSNWWEREIWDMFGIYFDQHPDLRRILTDYGFEGYPMRKDFPLYGFIELRYDEGKKKVVVEPVELTQEFRSFSFETPWS